MCDMSKLYVSVCYPTLQTDWAISNNHTLSTVKWVLVSLQESYKFMSITCICKELRIVVYNKLEEIAILNRCGGLESSRRIPRPL